MRKKPAKREIAATWRDWKGREVLLLKTTLTQHVASLHFEESFLLHQIKEVFSRPMYVVWNPAAKTENAVYDFPCANKRWLLVSVRKHWVMPCRVVATLYAVNDERLPSKDWELLFGKR